MEEQFVSLDGTILAQKALSAIKRTDEQINIFMVVEILRGVETKEIKKLKYNQLPTFGVGRDVSILDWLDYLEQMLNFGYLSKEEETELLKITESGMMVLMGKAKAELTSPSWQNSLTKKETMVEEPAEMNEVSEGNDDEALYKKLKGYTCVMAKRRNVPPYKVFQEGVLKALVAEKPAFVCQLDSIPGIGKRKVLQFGVGIVKIIRKHLGMSTDENEAWSSPECPVK